MTSDPRTDIVSSQYERWVYPAPIVDLPAWLEESWQWPDPSHSHRLFWPNREVVEDLDILVAGCGTNQAAVLAYTNPRSRVVAIDVSQPSLDHHRVLKDRYALDNLELRLLPIEEAEALNRDFDLIVSTGVLHHLQDPVVGLTRLGERLRPDGVASIMLYARYGRIGVEMLQGVFRELGLDQDERSLDLVRDSVAVLPADHPVQPYLTIAPDLQFDAGLVDTFLHGRDRSYTTGECIELATAAGLVFDDWLLKAPYAVPEDPDNAFLAAVAQLPREQQWSVMERIHFRNGCHFFNVCRPERPTETYRIDFSTDAFLDYVPSLRYRCTFDGSTIGRSDWTTPLVPAQQALLRGMDGRRTIGELVAAGATGTELNGRSEADRLAYARALFHSLWQLDVLGMGLRPA